MQLICSNHSGTISGQEDLIRILLLNLCSNALGACSPDVGIIRLEAKTDLQGTIISVIDNGCGIPSESLSRITEPFYRVDKSRSREFGGAGLGLCLCSQIAQVHGAKMTAKSSLATGTTVEILFTTP